jgi:hypothetical protein
MTQTGCILVWEKTKVNRNCDRLQMLDMFGLRAILPQFMLIEFDTLGYMRNPSFAIEGAVSS